MLQTMVSSETNIRLRFFISSDLLMHIYTEGYAGCAGYDTAICGGLDMNLMWNIMFWLIPIWVFFLIPFATFYYEADDGQLMAGTAYSPNPIKKSRLASAACYQLFVIAIVGTIFAVTYIGLSYTNIPVRELVGRPLGQKSANSQLVFSYFVAPNATGVFPPFNSSLLAPMGSADSGYFSRVVDNGKQEIELQVSLSTFYGGLMAWFGWFLFAIFGGIGLAALPLDLVLMYKNRPRHMDAVEYSEAQLSLRERVNELVDIGELIKIEREQKAQAGVSTGRFAGVSFDGDVRKAARDEKQAVLGFKQAVYLLEQDVEDFQNATVNYKKYNVLIPYIALLLGIFSGIISLFWFIHIIVYVFPKTPLKPFLNNYFKWFDRWFPLFGVLSVAIFVTYLLLAALKGCFKFGIRFLFFQIHPMKVGKTYMSSFMFNIALVLLCALPVVQFSQDAFADYAAFATVRQLFGVQVHYLRFFTFFWDRNIFVYIFLAMTFLTSLYLWCKPRDNAVNAQALRDRLRSRST